MNLGYHSGNETRITCSGGESITIEENIELKFVQETLRRLCITYRKFPCKNGWFFYCINPVNGISFDIKINDETIRIWKFIGTAPISKAGMRCEYCNPKYPHAGVGMEVTDEGDVSFYAEQKIDITDSRTSARIGKMIINYINLIADSSFVLSL